MSKTKQVFQNLFFGGSESSSGSGGGDSSSVSVADFYRAATGTDSAASSTSAVLLLGRNAATATTTTDAIAAKGEAVITTLHPVFSAIKAALASKVAVGFAVTGAAAAVATVIYISSLRAHALENSYWSVLLDAASMRTLGGNAKQRGNNNNNQNKKKTNIINDEDDDGGDVDSSTGRRQENRFHLFYADPTFYRTSRRLSVAGSQQYRQQQALTINLAAGLFLKEIDLDSRRCIAEIQCAPAFVTRAIRRLWDGMPQWMRLAVWDRWFKKKQQQQQPLQQQVLVQQSKNFDVPVENPRHVVVVVTEHAKLPSTYGSQQMSSRVVEVGFPVLGEITLHTAVAPAGAGAATSSVALPAPAPAPQAFDYYLRLVFLQQQQQHQQQQSSSSAGRQQPGLHNLVFSDCASAGDATADEDPQDIRVAAPSNLGITTVARYAASSTDDAPFPIISVDSHAKVSLLPPFPRKRKSDGDDIMGSESSLFPGAAHDPPDVLVHKTFFRRALKLTVYRSAMEHTSALLQKFDRTAGAADKKANSRFSPTSSMPQQQQQPTTGSSSGTVALHCAFVVVSVSNVAARVTSCTLDRSVQLEPLASQEQTAAVVRRLNTALSAAKQESPATASFGGGAAARQKAAAAAAAASSGHKQHFVFPLVRPSAEQSVNRLEKTIAAASHAATSTSTTSTAAAAAATTSLPSSPRSQNSSPKKKSGSSADASFNFAEPAEGALPSSSSSSSSSSARLSDDDKKKRDALAFDILHASSKRRIFPLNVEFEFEIKKYVPRKAASSAAAASRENPKTAPASPTDSITATLPAKQHQTSASEKTHTEDDDEEVDFFGRSKQADEQGELTADQKRRQQQRENRELLGLTVHLVWCALGEPPSAVHVKRCLVKQQQQQQQSAADESFHIRVLREAWNAMEVPVSY